MAPINQKYRYRFPPKSIKSACPNCGKNTLSRYVDSETGELLPEEYGRCDRESNCGYHLNPYHKDSSGQSYDDRLKGDSEIGYIDRHFFSYARKHKNKHLTRSGSLHALMIAGLSDKQADYVTSYIYDRPSEMSKKSKELVQTPICTIPEEVFVESLGDYQANSFAKGLYSFFGIEIGNQLLKRFRIGTSTHWPGACVFWFVDEQNRIRSGQVKLFDDAFHTAKYIDTEGKSRSKTSWLHATYALHYDKLGVQYPNWLKTYIDERNGVKKVPCLFGLPQLQNEPFDKPIAIVEAPKTAIICTAYFPEFIWLAVGALSYLNKERLAVLRGRKIELFPDTSANGKAYNLWSEKANALNKEGFSIEVSKWLEDHTNYDQKAKGWDLADFVLSQHKSYPQAGIN